MRPHTNEINWLSVICVYLNESILKQVNRKFPYLLRLHVNIRPIYLQVLIPFLLVQTLFIFWLNIPGMIHPAIGGGF